MVAACFFKRLPAPQESTRDELDRYNGFRFQRSFRTLPARPLATSAMFLAGVVVGVALLLLVSMIAK